MVPLADSRKLGAFVDLAWHLLDSSCALVVSFQAPEVEWDILGESTPAVLGNKSLLLSLVSWAHSCAGPQLSGAGHIEIAVYKVPERAAVPDTVQGRCDFRSPSILVADCAVENPRSDYLCVLSNPAHPYLEILYMVSPFALAPCTLYGLADRWLDATHVVRYVEAEMAISTGLA